MSSNVKQSAGPADTGRMSHRSGSGHDGGSSRVAGAAAVEREERDLAGKTSGLLFFLGGLTLLVLTVLPGVTHAHRDLLYGLALAAGAWGFSQAVAINWKRAPWWLIHLSNIASLGLIAVTVASTGGGRSPAWVYLFIVVVPAAYFYRPGVAIAYLIGCALTHATVLLYDPAAVHQYFLPQFAIAAPSYLALGAATLAGKRLLRNLRGRAEELAAEQSALRRVATAVVGDVSAEQFYELVAREAGALLGAGAAGIMRLENPACATVMGSWADHPDGRYAPGTRVLIRPASDIATAIETRLPVRITDHEPGTPVRRLGYESSVVTPILVAGQAWGVLAATAPDPGGLNVGDESRLTEFADLLAMAIISIENRAKLAAQASSDALTGLANRRTLDERLAAELARASRHGTLLSVAVIDIDHFKQVNDRGGHEAGDQMLVWVADCLSRQARAEDTLARIGGDEFAWLLPETSSDQAMIVVERACRAISHKTISAHDITASAGVCDSSSAAGPSELIRCADLALYWSKQHGRDQARQFDYLVPAQLAS
jgi:diguanylate cyclase (GGDEF)-like protein